MYEHIATLKKESGDIRRYDDYGNEEITYINRTVPVLPKAVYNSEFYNAAQAGLHPSITLFIANRADYQGETIVEYDGKLYDVIRADWKAQRDGITLILQERVKYEQSVV